MTYQRDPVKAPRLAGVALRAFVSAMESPVGAVLVDKLVKDSGIERFRSRDAGHGSPLQVPLPHPPSPGPVQSGEAWAQAAAALPRVAPGARLETAAEFTKAYREGTSSPVQVVRALEERIQVLEGGDRRMNFFIARHPQELAQAAEASATRWAKGAPLSPLDGVPVVIKDELDLAGYATTLGTKFLHDVRTVDSTVAARLKAAGALILGKANMNEIGINPIGLNPHYGPARNPWNRHHITGGSSSGSASTVAAGLAPISIGADGGGSIRIPAALCGVVGLKATFGRVSEAGVPPLCWQVGHVGPLGLTVADVATAYALIAGPDPRDPSSLAQPPPELHGLTERSLQGVRLGVCWPYFEDADADVVKRCREGLEALKAAGAVVVEIPPPDLNTVLWSHSCLILSEMRTAMQAHLAVDSRRFALDTRTNLAIGGHFRATDYVHAMRHRTRLTQEYLAMMAGVDVVVTPTCATTAPPIPEDALPEGDSNLPVTDGLMRFVRIGNLTGFPGLSVPVGYDAGGLPVGLQLMGRPYEEALLLRLGRVVEAAVPRRLPPVHVEVLPG